MNLKIQGVHESRHLPHNITLPHTPAFSTSVVDSSMLFSPHASSSMHPEFSYMLFFSYLLWVRNLNTA